MKEKKQDILKTLVPDSGKVSLDGKMYNIRGLSLKQALLLFREIAKIITLMGQADLSKLQEGSSNLEDLLVLFEMLDDKQIAKIISIVLNENDEEFVRKNLTLELVTDILALVCQYNDFGKMVKNAQRIAGAVQRKTC